MNPTLKLMYGLNERTVPVNWRMYWGGVRMHCVIWKSGKVLCWQKKEVSRKLQEEEKRIREHVCPPILLTKHPLSTMFPQVWPNKTQENAVRLAGWTQLTWWQQHPLIRVFLGAGIHEYSSGDRFSEPQSILFDSDLNQATELGAISQEQGGRGRGRETAGDNGDKERETERGSD